MGKRDTNIEDDAELWARVAQTAEPLKKKNRVARIAAPPKPAQPPKASSARKAEIKAPVLPPRPSHAPHTGLDRQTARKLDKGSLAVEARLDLHVLEFAHVSGPVVGGELDQRGLRDTRRSAVHAAGRELHEVRGQRGDVVATFAKRWNLNGENTETIEQILTEAPSFNLLIQVAIGRSDDSYVDLARARVAHPFQLLLLQDAKQLRLHRQWHFANFIE
jgi:hypothetical protein